MHSAFKSYASKAPGPKKVKDLFVTSRREVLRQEAGKAL